MFWNQLMKKLKLCETKKLHYNKYLYKMQIRNTLGAIFRTEFQKEGPLSYARQNLDQLTESYRRGEPLTKKTYRTQTTVPLEDYFDAKDIYTILKSASDYKIRVEPWPSFYIYSNDRSMLISIANKIRNESTALWEPCPENAQFLLSNSNVIIVDTPTPFPIRITLNGNTVNSDFAKWLKSNRDKSRVGDKTLAIISESGYCNGLYFHIRDSKVLSLVTLLIGSNIRRIDKLVYKENIDKY